LYASIFGNGRIDSLDGGKGNDRLVASSYLNNSEYAGALIYGGEGTDSFHAVSSALKFGENPNFSADASGILFYVPGNESLYIYVDYSVEILSFWEKAQTGEFVSVRYLTEDIAHNIIRRVGLEEERQRTSGSNMDWYVRKLDTTLIAAQDIKISMPSTFINEGDSFTAVVTTQNVNKGRTIFWELTGSGITKADFTNELLRGESTIADDGKFSILLNPAKDLISEGSESFKIILYSDSGRTIQISTSSDIAIRDGSNTNLSTEKDIAGKVASGFFGSALPGDKLLLELSDTKLQKVTASSWSESIQVNLASKGSNRGDNLDARQIDFLSSQISGSFIVGGSGNDTINGKGGWDVLDGGAGNDLIHGGNGRDIITGGAGRDELHGDFGWNTYTSEIDGVSDLIAIKSDQYLTNWLYGKAGNNANGEKADIIEGLDSIDKIKVIGVDTKDLTFASNAIAHGVAGIGIYGKGVIEALYIGKNLTLAQIQAMTTGDASAPAMSNSINAYGVW
jgi:Ca2+-binding RTX toxin-like protein